jgi:glycosyltransferase involved in cell wall biosynthesis
MAAAALAGALGGASAISWEESARQLLGTLEVAIHARSDAATSKRPPVADRAAFAAPAPDRVSADEPSVPAAARSFSDRSRMRILVMTNLYPRPGHENAGTYNRQQFRVLAAEHDVTLISPVMWTEELSDRWSGRPTASRYTNADGIDVRHPIYYYPPKMAQHRYGECYLASVRPEFERAVRENRPDVVLACFAYPDGWAAVRLAHGANLPVAIKVIGSDVLVAGRNRNRRPCVASAIREADAIAAVSRDLAEHSIDLGADPDRIFVVPEGIDRTLFHPLDRTEARTRLGVPSDVPMVLFVGNLLLSKGAGVLVEACGHMARSGVDFRCYIVGRGRDESRVRALVAKLGLGDRVTLVGPRPLGELADWYASSDVVTLPSYSEGIPNVLREARACGRPFVATRVGGIPEISDPSTSVLVDPGASEALAAALADVLGGRMAAAALAGALGGASAISWEESARQLLDTLRRAIQTRASGFAGEPDSSRGPRTLMGGFPLTEADSPFEAERQTS